MGKDKDLPWLIHKIRFNINSLVYLIPEAYLVVNIINALDYLKWFKLFLLNIINIKHWALNLQQLFLKSNDLLLNIIIKVALAYSKLNHLHILSQETSLAAHSKLGGKVLNTSVINQISYPT